ncbi:MAG TPA: hypothetical protein VK191_11765 [Symbiobacteriaceae bacterium]|nr:hypothetical protein [Symbiobacteriaceae bacterium]
MADELQKPRVPLAGRLGEILSQDRTDRARFREEQSADGLILVVVAAESESLPFLNEFLPGLAHERGLGYTHTILDELDEIPRQKLARAQLVLFDLPGQSERTRDVVRQVRAARKRLLFTAHSQNDVPRNYTHIPCAVYNPNEPAQTYFLRKVAEGLAGPQPVKSNRAGATGRKRGRPPQKSTSKSPQRFNQI